MKADFGSRENLSIYRKQFAMTAGPKTDMDRCSDQCHCSKHQKSCRCPVRADKFQLSDALSNFQQHLFWRELAKLLLTRISRIPNKLADELPYLPKRPPAPTNLYGVFAYVFGINA